MTNEGQTALSIAQRLGYISVIETLKVVTTTVVSTTTTTVTEEKYKVVAPETMQETFMSDSEDEGGMSFTNILFSKALFLFYPSMNWFILFYFIFFVVKTA